MSNVDAGAVEVSDLVRSMVRARQQRQEPSATFDQAVPRAEVAATPNPAPDRAGKAVLFFKILGRIA